MPIDNDDIERLKEIFVARKDCDITTSELDKQIKANDVQLAVISAQLKMIIWLIGAVGSGVIAMLVKMFFGG